MSSLRPRKRAKRTSARACRAPRRGRALARGGFWFCCGRRGLGGYPRDGLLSLFHGPGYVGHQLFQIVLGVFKLRRLCVHFYLPIRRPPQEKGLARSIQGQSEQSLKTLRREPFSQRIIPSSMEQRSSDPLSLLSARLRAVAVQRFAIPSLAVFCSCGGAHHLFGWDAVYLLGVDAHEVLPAAGDDIRL